MAKTKKAQITAIERKIEAEKKKIAKKHEKEKEAKELIAKRKTLASLKHKK